MGEIDELKLGELNGVAAKMPCPARWPPEPSDWSPQGNNVGLSVMENAKKTWKKQATSLAALLCNYAAKKGIL